MADRYGGTDTITGSSADERFDDGETEFDLTEFANFASLDADDFASFVQMYIAYFDRAPDAVGLYFWGTVLANGDLTLEEIADDFFTQPETQATYPDLSDNSNFAQQVYMNVLGRPFDQAGLDFWVGVLDSEAVTKSQFILELLEGVYAPAPPGSSPAFIAQKRHGCAVPVGQDRSGRLFLGHSGHVGCQQRGRHDGIVRWLPGD